MTKDDNRPMIASHRVRIDKKGQKGILFLLSLTAIIVNQVHRNQAKNYFQYTRYGLNSPQKAGESKSENNCVFAIPSPGVEQVKKVAVEAKVTFAFSKSRISYADYSDILSKCLDFNRARQG
mgnify:FL=1